MWPTFHRSNKLIQKIKLFKLCSLFCIPEIIIDRSNLMLKSFFVKNTKFIYLSQVITGDITS